MEKYEALQIRPIILAFTATMEEKMLANNHKGCWRRCDPLWLYAKLGEEVGELGRILVRNHNDDTGKATREAIDIANVAMMIADRLENGSGIERL